MNRYAFTANNPVNLIDPSGYNFVEYSIANENSDEEGASLEPVGKKFASEADEAVTKLFNELDDDIWEMLTRNAGDLGEGAADTIRAQKAEEAASQLVNEGLHSPNAQALIDDLARYATNNSDSNIVSLGKWRDYIEVAESRGYTFYNLPGKSWDIIEKGGKDFAWEVNERFMLNQIEAGKDFGVSLGEATQPGFYGQKEVDMLMELVKKDKYIIKFNDSGFNYIFKYITR